MLWLVAIGSAFCALDLLDVLRVRFSTHKDQTDTTHVGMTVCIGGRWIKEKP